MSNTPLAYRLSLYWMVYIDGLDLFWALDQEPKTS